MKPGQLPGCHSPDCINIVRAEIMEVHRLKTIIHIVKGVIIGIATLVPGVSGGTMAIILGLYDDIIHSISSFFKDIKGNFIFLGTVGIGGVIGLLGFSRLMEFCLENFKFPMTYLFIGIIIGGIPVLYKKANTGKRSIKNWLYFAIGFIIILVMSLYTGTFVDLASSTGALKFIFLFVTGIVIAVALILPGISTSFMLLALGMYDITVNALSNVEINYLIPLALGVGFGVIATTRILENFLTKKPAQTYMLILGFVIGSIIEVFPGIPTGLDIVISIATLLLGYVVIRAMGEKYAE